VIVASSFALVLELTRPFAAVESRRCDDVSVYRSIVVVVVVVMAHPHPNKRYFDNVGADHFEAAFDSLRPRGRIAICGESPLCFFLSFSVATVPVCSV
jgi:hypothetical protein